MPCYHLFGKAEGFSLPSSTTIALGERSVKSHPRRLSTKLRCGPASYYKAGRKAD